MGCSLVTIKNSNVQESTNAIVVKDKDSINPTIINIGNLNFERTKQSYLLSSNTIINNIYLYNLTKRIIELSLIFFYYTFHKVIEYSSQYLTHP